MTAQSVSVPEPATTSYAAALASGSTTKSVGPQSTMGSVNGGFVTGTSTPLSVLAEPRPKSNPGGSASAPQLSRQSSPSLPQSKDDASATAVVSDERSNGWEGSSQTSDRRESKSSGIDTARGGENAQPTVNVWKKRQEEIAAKAKPSSVILPATSPSPTSASKSDKGQNGKKNDEWDGKEKNRELDSSKDYKDKKGSDDGTYQKVAKGSRRGHGQDQDTHPTLPPPPVTDTVSWPTPDLAQGEFKKEKEKDDKEKEKPTPASGREKKWLPVPIDPPYVLPIQTKSGRGGRGSRGGREGGRGGSGQSSDRPEKAVNAGQNPSEDRGRQYPNTRGGFKGSKRSSSSGANIQRRESRAAVTNGVGDRKKDGADWHTDGSASSGVTSSATQTEKPRNGSRGPARGTDEGAFSSDTRSLADGQERLGNGHYQSRGERGGSHWTYPTGERRESDTMGYQPRERGAERGRGGYRGRYGQYSNGHHGGSYANTQFGQNGHAYPPHTHPRGGSFRGRGHSSFSGHPYRFNPAMQPPPPPHLAYSSGSSYEFNPMTAGTSSMVDLPTLINQINYYFSVENLCKDIYLRKHMDSDGFVRLAFLMSFARVQGHTKDINVLRDACLQSQEIVLTFGVDDCYVRKQDGWENWVLKEEERDESARRSQADWHIDPRQRKPNGVTPPGEMSASAEPFFPGSSNMMPMFYSHGMNPPYGYSTPASTLSAAVPEFSPSGQKDSQSVPLQAEDECPDNEVDTLIVVVKRPAAGEGATASPEPSPTGNAINGAPDAANIAARLQDTPLTNGSGAHDEAPKAQVNGSGIHGNHRARRSQSDIGWFNSPRSGFTVETSMTHRSYTEVRAQALRHREAGGPGKNNDLITLYKFWSHFLVKRFNASMYREFKTFALQDADNSVRLGVEEIFKLYERSFRDRMSIGLNVIRDFVELVRVEARHGESLGVDKLKSILANASLNDEYKHTIESLVDTDLRNIMIHGVGKKNDRSPAAEPYSASIILA